MSRAIISSSPPRAAIAVGRAVVRLAAVTVLLGALAACGGDTTAPPAPPVSVSISPSSATTPAGGTAQFTATVTNTTTTAVTWTASAGTITPSGTSATWTAPGAGGSYTVTATSTADATKSATATITVSPVAISVAPATSTVGAGDTVALTASVSGAVNAAVSWSASGGSVVGTGDAVRWAAPVTGGSYTVTATSVLDPSRTGTATVTVTPVSVTVTAAASALFREEGTTLTAAVSGTSDPRVTWTSSCGTVSGSGATVQFTAPTTPGTCTVRATSVRDPATQGAAPLRIRAAWRVAALTDENDGACTFAHCTLREAIVASNAAPDRDSILIVVGAASSTITLTTDLPFVTQPLDLVGPGASALTIDAAGTAAAPRRVLYVDGGFTASVRGVTLRNGRRTGGGGLVIDNNANVTLRDVHVRDNVSTGAPGGGVLALRGGRGTFVDVEIVGNRSEGPGSPGGGLSVDPGSMVTMVRGRLADNEATDAFGGGARTFNGSLMLDSTVVTGNRAPATTGSLGIGGGLFADGADARLQLVGVSMTGNSAAIAGGGMSIRGGTIATVTGGTIGENSAPVGAGFEVGDAAVTVVNTQVTRNTASQRGGGVLLFGAAAYTHTGGGVRENVASANGGGGLYLQQTAQASLTNVTVADNRADGNQSGGGIWMGNASRLTLSGGALSGNRATTVGGGLFSNSTGAVSLQQVSVERNETVSAGGGVFVNATATFTIAGGRFVENRATGGGGGGIYAQAVTLVVDSTRFAGNTATQSGGALLMLTSGSSTLRQVLAEDNEAFNGGAFGFSGTMAVVIEGGVVRRNRASNVGGGVWKAGQSTLAMTGTQVLENTATAQGGGVQLVGPGAPATLRRVTVRGNTATNASGGGVTAGVPVLVEQSTFANNTAGAIGGGLFAAGTGNLTLRTSTFSANVAIVGGGLAATGPAALTNATFVANSASDYGAGIGTNNAGAVTVTNVLLAGNLVGSSAGNCGSGGTSTITSAGGNLSADETCTRFSQPTDKPNTPAGVNTTLADNGGPTFTHALLEGSAAINAAVPAACPTTDQRGFTRVGACDIGAVEFGGAPPAPVVRRR